MIDYDNQYNNSLRVQNFDEYVKGWEQDSVHYRDTSHGDYGISYGISSRMRYDYFPAQNATPSSPLALFIHGGYWQMMDESYFSHLAKGLNIRGINVAIGTYDLCPDVLISDIVEQVRRLCVYLWENYHRPLMVFGHSAGGHLTAAMLATNWRAYGVPNKLVYAGLAVSGLFDLLPLTHTFVNKKVQMSKDEAASASPIAMPLPIGVNFVAAVGSKESDEFKKQSRNITSLWKRGNVNAHFYLVKDRHHFDVIEPFTDPDSLLTNIASDLAYGTFTHLCDANLLK